MAACLGGQDFDWADIEKNHQTTKIGAGTSGVGHNFKTQAKLAKDGKL